MASGSYLEFNALSDCKLYGPKGDLLKEVNPEGPVPSLIQGENELRFSCDPEGEVLPRARVTVMTLGETL